MTPSGASRVSCGVTRRHFARSSWILFKNYTLNRLQKMGQNVHASASIG